MDDDFSITPMRIPTGWRIAAFGLTTSTIMLLAAAAGALIDYNQWKAFGTGGTPPTLRGYLKVTKLRFRRLLSKDDLTVASHLPRDGLCYLKGQLPLRAGPRPKIIGRTLPQRQYPEKLDEAVRERLHALPAKYAAEYSHLLRLDKSATEGGSTDAIYATPNDTPAADDGKETNPRAHDKILRNEIAHVHPAENSLHVWLTLVDARKVVEAGWGERFPLSSLGMVDEGWTFVYAPRTMEEVDVVERIVRAGIAHLTGGEGKVARMMLQVGL